jgi:hypothetical protein
MVEAEKSEASKGDHLAMPYFLRHQLMGAAAVIGLLGALVAFVGFAQDGGDVTPSGLEATETLEATEAPEATESPEATETPEPTEGQQPLETPDGDDDASVPPDSPACAGDLDHPNPQDTDGDGDGCRVVDTADGPKNLPDPAADAIEGNPGTIGQGDGHGPPDGVPQGPPDGVPQGPPDGVPQGPPDGVPQGPPDGVPQGPPPWHQPD